MTAMWILEFEDDHPRRWRPSKHIKRRTRVVSALQYVWKAEHKYQRARAARGLSHLSGADWKTNYRLRNAVTGECLMMLPLFHLLGDL